VIRRAALLGLASLGLFAALPPGLSGQTDPRLQAAVQLAQSGRMDSARAVVHRLLATLPATDSVYPEALYTEAIVASDTTLLTTDLQRVVIEYGLSPWADDALLRLTQFHWAQGDPNATIQSAERLRRDYASSPLKARADLPAARAYFDLKDEAHGCALIQEALAGAGDDVEFRNQVNFYSARCAAAPPVAALPDTARKTDSSAAPAAPVYSVQVLAVKNAGQVDDMLTRLHVMGFDARVVRDSSGLLKVRVGRYATHADAEAAQRRVKSKLGGQPFVVQEP